MAGDIRRQWFGTEGAASGCSLRVVAPLRSRRQAFGAATNRIFERNPGMNQSRQLQRVNDEEGGVTVEFVIWLPVFLLVMMLTVDVSMVFLAQSRMWDVARDAARRMSLGLMDETEAEAFAGDGARFKSSAIPTVDATVGSTEVSIVITIQGQDVNLFGVFPFSASQPITARVVQLKEPS